MRFEVRFNNGVYHVFDTFTYRAVEAYYKTQGELAQSRANQLNAEPRRRSK
jgi:hypothetical protein